METVAFYSYKGGVGRSLLLANTARFLAALGKKVVSLDLDFEAPGLHYKLGPVRSLKERSKKGGVVPYLVAAAKGGAAPSLDKQLITIPVPPEAGGWLRLMPAGPSPAQSYWAALKELGERLRFDDPSGQGVMALLDLQTRIAEDLKPDYLLVDARTGVTELGSLATTLLADTVVCLFVPNQESLDGTLAVVEALKSAPRLTGQAPVRVVPVVSRLLGEKLSGDDKFTDGVNRLIELGESRISDQTKQPELFALPHDEALAARERVVAGEQKASDFSPLYKAYLDLFQALFPASTKRAQQVLERLAAVAEIKADLTRPHHGRHGFGSDLPSWNASAIQEGVAYEAEQGGPGSRYADLVCQDDAGLPLMAVEYVTEDDKAAAMEFWAKRTRLRCVVLVIPGQHGGYRDVLTRLPHRNELRDTGRWDPPLPKEFELLADVGDVSVEPMLDALRRGHAEAVPWLVNLWQDSTAAEWSDHPMRRREWRPGVSRRILDGLAATEDLVCAEEILRRATPGYYEDRPHGRRRFRDDMSPGDDELDERMSQGLFAPLFWRLPVEAVASHSKPRRHPEERPSPAGFRLLAQDVMGLIYDPDRGALVDAQAMAGRLVHTPTAEDDADDRRTLRWVHRRRWEQTEYLNFLDDLPPALVWDAVLREDSWFRGTLEEARNRAGEKDGGRLLASTTGLRGRLRTLAERRELAAQGLLGTYDVSGRLDLYPAVITAGAEVLGLAPRFLKSVVFIYFSAWRLSHRAFDLDGQPGFGFAPTPISHPFARESPVHVGLAQAFTHRLIVRLEDANLLAAFEKLTQHQPESYHISSKVREMPLEELRTLLLRARASAPAMGYPWSGD